VRRILNILFLLLAVAAVALTIFDPSHPLIIPAVALSGLILLLIILTRATGSFKPIRLRPAPSLIAEMERLYFRSMREMLTDAPNLAQVINDLQRVLSIDPTYKNARHYLNRALILQEDSNELSNGHKTHSKTEFMRLQEKLIDLDPTVRKSVVMELINYKEMAVDPLTALLMDEDADVRVHAATALGWVGGPDAVQPLLVALQDSDLLVRRYAARALCWVVDDTATDGLIAALRDEDNYVRSYAARALGWSHAHEAVPALQALLEDESGDVRSYARTALEDLGASKADQNGSAS
jgi:hypothetical protein